jgi:hypothetical protein
MKEGATSRVRKISYIVKCEEEGSHSIVKGDVRYQGKKGKEGGTSIHTHV